MRKASLIAALFILPAIFIFLTVPSLACAADPWQALNQAPGIELRDENNRIISRAAVQRQIGEGERQERRQAASVSPLPRKSSWLDQLDAARHLAAGLRGNRGGLPLERADVLPPPRSRKVFVAGSSSGPCPASTDSRVALSPLQLTYSPGRVLALVLRC